MTYRLESDRHVLAFDRNHRGGAPVPTPSNLGVVRAFAQHLHGGAGTVKETRRAAPGHLRVGRVLALAGGALREKRPGGWVPVGEVTLGGIRASERGRARPRRRVPGRANHGKRRDATRPYRPRLVIRGSQARFKNGVRREAARTWKPVRSETKLSGGAASAGQNRGGGGRRSARRVRACARGDKAGARVAQIGEACAVLELARTRGERRRGGVRARA